MTANAIALVFLGLTATLTRPTSRNHPRERPNLITHSRTLYGTSVRRGPSYAAPHLWQCSFMVNEDQRDTLIVQHDGWTQSPAAILIYDTATPFSEATRTRAAVPGTTPGTKGGRALYYAQFKGEFSSALKISTVGAGTWQADFQLIETEVVPA